MIDLRTMSILIVDDMESMCKAIRGMLMVLNFGQDFFYAANGQEALSLLNRTAVDLVISDWNMPTMTGVELLARMKEDQRLRDIPLVMVTAEANKEIVAEAAEAEIDAYILKPITVEALGRKISEVVERVNNPSPMQQHLKNARQLTEAGEYAQALAEASQAMEAEPRSSKPVHELGFIYYLMQNYQQAETWLSKAAEMNHMDVFAFHYLGDIYLKTGRLDEAIQAFDKISPRHVGRAVDFGKLLIEQGLIEKAMGLFERAAGLADDPASLQQELAQLCRSKGYLEQAVKLFKGVLKEQPNRSEIKTQIGQLYVRLEKFDKALPFLNEAASLDDKNVAIKLLMARCYIGLKQVGWAERTINEILRLDPDNHEARELMELY